MTIQSPEEFAAQLAAVKGEVAAHLETIARQENRRMRLEEERDQWKSLHDNYKGLFLTTAAERDAAESEVERLTARVRAYANLEAACRAAKAAHCDDGVIPQTPQEEADHMIRQCKLRCAIWDAVERLGNRPNSLDSSQVPAQPPEQAPSERESAIRVGATVAACDFGEQNGESGRIIEMCARVLFADGKVETIGTDGLTIVAPAAGPEAEQAPSQRDYLAEAESLEEALSELESVYSMTHTERIRLAERIRAAVRAPAPQAPLSDDYLGKARQAFDELSIRGMSESSPHTFELAHVVAHLIDWARQQQRQVGGGEGL